MFCNAKQLVVSKDLQMPSLGRRGVGLLWSSLGWSPAESLGTTAFGSLLVGENSSGMKGKVWPAALKTLPAFTFVAGVVTWLEENEPATAGKGTGAAGRGALSA